jgi:hypothetical protein
MAEITGTGVPEMKALAVKLRAADPALQRELRRQFRQIANPLAESARQSIMSMPAKDEDAPPHLRAEVAKTVYASVGITKTGVRVDIVSNGNRMPEGMRNIPAYLDQPQGWSHPVFAHGERFHLGRSRARKFRFRPAVLRPLVKRGSWTWVKQVGKPGWFEGPLEARAGFEGRDAAQAAIESVKRKLGA